MESRIDELHNDLQSIHSNYQGKRSSSCRTTPLKRRNTEDLINLSSKHQVATGLNSADDTVIASKKTKHRPGYRKLTIRSKQPLLDTTKNYKPKNSPTRKISTGSIPTKFFHFLSHNAQSPPLSTPKNNSPPNQLSAPLNTSALMTPASSANTIIEEKSASSSQEDPSHYSYRGRRHSTRSEEFTSLTQDNYTSISNASTPNIRTSPFAFNYLENINKSHLPISKPNTSMNERQDLNTEFDIKGGTLV